MQLGTLKVWWYGIKEVVSGQERGDDQRGVNYKWDFWNSARGRERGTGNR